MESLDKEPEWFQNPLDDDESAVLASFLATALCLPGCGADEVRAPDGVFFPTVPRQDSYPAALMTGMLEERSGCVFVRSGEERWLLLWPEGYTARIAQDGTIEVLDDDGAIVGAVGQMVSLGGGETNPVEVGGAAAADRWAVELTGEKTPERCGSLYWLVSP